MRSAYLVAPRTFEIRESEPPPVPDDGVLVRVKACGVCGSDLRRWKEDITIPAGGMKIQDGKFEPMVVENRNYQNHMFYGPIPYNEILKA